MAETVVGSSGRVYIGLGAREGGRRRGKWARETRLPLMAQARLGERFPNESEGEREGREGEKRRESRGVISPSLMRAGTAGCGGFGGGGGARARAGGERGAR